MSNPLLLTDSQGRGSKRRAALRRWRARAEPRTRDRPHLHGPPQDAGATVGGDAIFTTAVVGLTFIPFEGADGELHRMSFFDAFYFISYAGTTIGFGEPAAGFSTDSGSGPPT